ncbi:LIC_10190 family membrane protein [Hymenobacter sp. GOD-10R]|uniref:LIC_10190 family membrane protein n=1 Tax=Hymenobacter sp. GOD-10R TaxID=3093922 RepID=UPI002D79EC93|nr:hypothetical protein [Hymenobacter sp. GOD-10R]WRQ27481.1 hypothetical protein SD425_20640 [Hymenobacter sp. GOD-10R]
MATLFLCWLLLGACTTLLGWTAWRLVARLRLPGFEEVLPAELLSLIGLALLTGVLQLASLFWAINAGMQVITAGMLGLLAIGQRHAIAVELGRWPAQWQAGGWRAVLLGGLVWLWLLTLATTLTTNFDAGLYHLQTLRWLNEYPAIPGLGNLHGRLAFNPSTFAPTVLFQYATPGGPAYGLPSYLFVVLGVAAAQAVAATRTMSTGDIREVWAPPLLLFLLLWTFQVWLSCPTPDHSVTIPLVFAFLLYARKWTRGYGKQLDAITFVVLLLTLWAATIKLAALPALLLPAHSLWVSRRQLTGRALALVGGLVVLLLGPWLTRNVVLSGYLIYPLPALDLFTVDWKIPGWYARMEHNMIANLGQRASQSPYSVPRQTLLEWLPGWWTLETTYNRVVLLAAAISPLPAVWRWRRAPASELGWIVGWAVAWLGVVFWFLTAPDFRFATAFLLIAGVWPWLSWFPRWRLARVRYLPWALALLWVLHNLRDPLYQLRYQPRSIVSRVVWPAPAPLPATIAIPVGKLLVRVPREGAQCWGTPLPCVHCIEAGLEPRGASLREGFRMRPNR